MRNLIFSAVVLSIAIQAESPAVTKVLTLFNDLNTAKNEKAAGRAKKVSFTLTDGELNQYLRHALTVNPRPGLDAMRVQFYPSNYLATLVTVDFDAVERFRPGTVPMLLRPILNGKRAIQVDVRLQPQTPLLTRDAEKKTIDLGDYDVWACLKNGGTLLVPDVGDTFAEGLVFKAQLVHLSVVVLSRVG